MANEWHRIDVTFHPQDGPEHAGVKLRITGDTLDPDGVTRRIGVTPTFSGRRGDPVEGGGTLPTGSWGYDVGGTEEWIVSDALELLLERLPDDAELWAELTAEFDVRLVCIVVGLAADTSVAIPSNLVRGVAERRWELHVSFVSLSRLFRGADIEHESGEGEPPDDDPESEPPG